MRRILAAATVAATVLDHRVWAYRLSNQQVLSSVGSLDASVETQTFKIPKPCKNSWLDSSDCCMCSNRRGSFMKLGVKIDTCASFDFQENKDCCETWATDCEEEDPWFQNQLRKECTVPSEVCEQNECANVLADLNKVDDMLDEFDDKRKAIRSKTLKRQHTKAKGKRRADSMGCPTCECGEPVFDQAKPDQALQCMASKTVWCVLATRDCCTNLLDCAEQDAWPQLVEKDYQQYRKVARKIDAKKKEGLEVRLKLLKLESKCVKDCQTYRKPICLDWMKKNQRSDVQQKWNGIKAAYNKNEDEAKAAARYWDDRLALGAKKRQEELNRQSYARQREGQQEMVDNFKQSMKDTMYDAASMAKGLMAYHKAYRTA